MKIIIYSDLHLEKPFSNKFKPPKDSHADLMILAGDIINFDDFEPLKRFLEGWNKPVIFVAGNHEYYTKKPMLEGEERFFDFIKTHQPNIAWLYNDSLTISNAEFFGGTMWTNFAHSPLAIMTAKQQMNDYRWIYKSKTRRLQPEDTIKFHNEFNQKLISWLEENKDKKRVVITHHAPCRNPNSKFKGSALEPAFNSLEMVAIIEKYQPELWIYGHTHECDDQIIGKTRIVSNQFGYAGRLGNPECEGFDPNRILIEI